MGGLIPVVEGQRGRGSHLIVNGFLGGLRRAGKPVLQQRHLPDCFQVIACEIRLSAHDRRCCLLDQGGHELDLVTRLEQIRMEMARGVEGDDSGGSEKQYEDVFRDAGIGRVNDEPGGVADSLQWANTRRDSGERGKVGGG